MSRTDLVNAVDICKLCDRASDLWRGLSAADCLRSAADAILSTDIAPVDLCSYQCECLGYLMQAQQEVIIIR